VTESEAVGKLKELCDKLATGASIAERSELPEVFRLIGMLVDVQQREIKRLQAQVAKLEDEVRSREGDQSAGVIEAAGFILKNATGGTLAELVTNDTGSPQLLLFGADGKRKVLLSAVHAAGCANVPCLDLFDDQERLRVRLGVHEPRPGETNPHGPPQLIFCDEAGKPVSSHHAAGFILKNSTGRTLAALDTNVMWFFGEDNAEIAAVELEMTNEGLKLTAYNQEAGVVYSAVLGKAATS